MRISKVKRPKMVSDSIKIKHEDDVLDKVSSSLEQAIEEKEQELKKIRQESAPVIAPIKMSQPASSPSKPKEPRIEMAEGGRVKRRIADSILSKRSSQADISNNNKEEPNQIDYLNEMALDEDMNEDIADMDQPIDSNEIGHEDADEEINSRDRIAQIMKRRRMKVK